MLHLLQELLGSNEIKEWSSTAKWKVFVSAEPGIETVITTVKNKNLLLKSDEVARILSSTVLGNVPF
jgi:hypothetical protein